MNSHKLSNVGCILLLSSLAFPAHKPVHKENPKDPAFVHGYDDGYRIGAQDSAVLSSAYRDANGPIYEQATDAYTPSYRDLEIYKRRFRRGYIEGYKAGWDFNAGQYSPHY
jgi:hypothetical protein